MVVSFVAGRSGKSGSGKPGKCCIFLQEVQALFLSCGRGEKVPSRRPFPPALR